MTKGFLKKNENKTKKYVLEVFVSNDIGNYLVFSRLQP